MKRKVAIGITGASGAIYVKLLLERLAQLNDTIETALVWSANAQTVWKEELDDDDFLQYDFATYGIRDYYAPFASGSSDFDTFIIIPCSMGTLGRIASGVSDNLITRAADVMLKERKKLICVIRETPYNLIHINNMKIVTEAGGIICPASPSFYSRPASLDTACKTVIERVLKLSQIDNSGFKWGMQST